MTTHRKQFASPGELNQRLEESAAIVASYEQEQPHDTRDNHLQQNFS